MLEKFTILLGLLFAASLRAQVQVESLPEQGIQPQVAVSAEGMVHLVYIKGDAKACDIRHTVRRAGGSEWAAPVTVKRTPHSAIAIGSIRGAQIALGKDDVVQVIWNGSAEAKPDGMAQAPLLHARLMPGATAFSHQQNLLGDTRALDGGASIAANGKGRVAVVWHAAPPGEDEESARLVWVRYSEDDGSTFSAPALLNTAQPGVCACCSLRAHLAADGTLSVLYRAATAPTERGMCLITETRNAKHPTLARNSKGQTLIASIIGSGWSKAGTLHWDLLDAGGLIIASGDGRKLPVWSYAATYAQPDGGFVILR